MIWAYHRINPPHKTTLFFPLSPLLKKKKEKQKDIKAKKTKEETDFSFVRFTRVRGGWDGRAFSGCLVGILMDR